MPDEPKQGDPAAPGAPTTVDTPSTQPDPNLDAGKEQQGDQDLMEGMLAPTPAQAPPAEEKPAPGAEAPAPGAPPVQAPAATGTPPAAPTDPMEKLKTVLDTIAQRLTPAQQQAAAAKPAPTAPKFEFYKVTPEQAAAIFESPEKAAEFINTAIHGLRAEIAQAYIPYVEQALVPVYEHLNTQVRESERAKFGETYQDLKEFTDVAEAIANNVLQRDPDSYKRDSKAFLDNVAQLTRQWVQQYGPRFQPKGAPAPTAPPPPAPARGAAPRVAKSPPNGAAGDEELMAAIMDPNAP